MDPFELIHYIHAARELQEWWEGPHDGMGRITRAVAGQEVFERLPERFRTAEVADKKLMASRQQRSALTKTGQYNPRSAAFLPTGWNYYGSISLLAADGLSTVQARSEPTGSRTPQDYASRARAHAAGEADATEPFSPAVTFGHNGVARRFARRVPSELQFNCLEQYCVLDGRGYSALGATPRAGGDRAFALIAEGMASLKVELRVQPELKRVYGDIGVIYSPNWLVIDTLIIKPPLSEVQATIKSIPMPSDQSLASEISNHGGSLSSLPGYKEVSYQAELVFGGRNGMRRIFGYRSGGGSSVGCVADYYAEAGRFYVAVTNFPSSDKRWAGTLSKVTSRFAIV
jgi:hypothetical protein